MATMWKELTDGWRLTALILLGAAVLITALSL
jgi:hypothetical protein